jgi:hypothetical protein
MNRLILLALFLVGNIYPQQLKVSADKTNVSVNERFEVYFEFEADNLNGIKSFKPPAFGGLQVISGPNQSSSMQIINGNASASITFSFIVFAPQTGKYTIGPASLNYQGKEFVSSSLTINAERGKVQSPNSGGSNSSADVSKEEIAKNVFIIASADKSSVYKGEQVTVTYKLYTRLDISSPQVTKLPTYKDFWAEEIETGNNIQLNIEMYKGERYRTAVLKKVALFPTSTGTLSVTPFELNIPVIITKKRNSRDIFDDFFNDPFFQRRETVEFLARSNKLNIKVKPLPTNNIPKSFKGAVGNYQVTASLNKEKVEANESVNYKINISGTGNIKLLEMPEIEFPASFDKYDPKVSETIINKGQISGNKSADYLIIPRAQGKMKIGGFEFSYFNPARQSYVVINIPDKIIEVKGGSASSQYSSGNLSKENIKLLSQDIRYIKLSNPDLVKKENLQSISSWFIPSLIIPVIIFIGLLLFIKQNEKLEANARLFRYMKAEKVARKRLREAEKAKIANNHFVFYDEVAKALQGYLEDKLGIAKSEFTKEFVSSLLLEKGVDNKLVENVIEILSTCEFMKYSPSTDKLIYTEFYQRTAKAIVDLENVIGVKGK